MQPFSNLNSMTNQPTDPALHRSQTECSPHLRMYARTYECVCVYLSMFDAVLRRCERPRNHLFDRREQCLLPQISRSVLLSTSNKYNNHHSKTYTKTDNICEKMQTNRWDRRKIHPLSITSRHHPGHTRSTVSLLSFPCNSSISPSTQTHTT